MECPRRTFLHRCRCGFSTSLAMPYPIHTCAHPQPQYGQPTTMTREEVWDVLRDCYHIACPSTAQGTTTGSIVWHGCARGPSDSVEEHCDEHHHIATLSLRKCYWRKIKKVAAQVPLHAVCHDSCSSMYCYPHAPSDQKLLSELDSHYGLSRVHPSGEASQKILAEGKDFANVGLRGCTRRLKISSSLSLLHSSIRWWTMVCATRKVPLGSKPSSS